MFEILSDGENGEIILFNGKMCPPQPPCSTSETVAAATHDARRPFTSPPPDFRTVRRPVVPVLVEPGNIIPASKDPKHNE